MELSTKQVETVMEMLEISESVPATDRQMAAGLAADDSMAAMVRQHGQDEMLGACARFLRERLFEAVERC